MIQTNTSTIIFNGLNLLIEPKHISNPRGNDNNNVKTNSRQVNPKPSNRYRVTSLKDII